MKQQFFNLCMILMSAGVYAQVGINNPTPNASAALDITSTTKGFLPPRMTSVERDAIATPATGLTIYNTNVNCLQWWNGTVWYDGCGNNAVFCDSGATTVVDVTNPITGKIWMDRNLGASQAATSSTDANSYGDLYQWGRRSDGHQCRTSTTSTLLSRIDQPWNYIFFITDNSGNFDWRSPQNSNLWQGVNGVNNPCPSGYRLPTQSELNEELLSWGSNANALGAFNSPLKLPMAGFRIYDDGSIFSSGLAGYYWGSTVSFTTSSFLVFGSTVAAVTATFRASGHSVRCIKD